MRRSGLRWKMQQSEEASIRQVQEQAKHRVAEATKRLSEEETRLKAEILSANAAEENARHQIEEKENELNDARLRVEASKRGVAELENTINQIKVEAQQLAAKELGLRADIEIARQTLATQRASIVEIDARRAAEEGTFQQVQAERTRAIEIAHAQAESQRRQLRTMEAELAKLNDDARVVSEREAKIRADIEVVRLANAEQVRSIEAAERERVAEDEKLRQAKLTRTKIEEEARQKAKKD